MLVDTDIGEASTHEAPALPSKVTIDDEQFHVPVPEVELEGDVEVHGLPDLDTAAKDKLIAEATSVRHMMTHRPKNPMCESLSQGEGVQVPGASQGPCPSAGHHRVRRHHLRRPLHRAPRGGQGRRRREMRSPHDGRRHQNH